MQASGIDFWLQRQLKPLSAAMTKVPPEFLSWVSLLASLGAGTLLFSANESPVLAEFAVCLLALRLISDSIESNLVIDGENSAGYSPVVSKLIERLSDLVVFLSLAFWTEIRVHLVLLAVVCMLMVSYAGELGRAYGATDCNAGILAKTNRIVLLMLFSLVYGFKPHTNLGGYSVFEVMFVLFIPLASITLLQRLDRVLSKSDRQGKD